MTKIYRILALFVFAAAAVSCTKDDANGTAQLRDYQTQYNSDIADIELFLKTHSYSVVNNPGGFDDQDVTYTEVPENDPTAIWSSPNLMFRMHTRNGVDYKIYYVKLREGGGADASALRSQPTNVDAVLAAYEGRYLFHKITNDENGVATDTLKHFVFETNPFPDTFLPLQGTVPGWSEIFPQFRPGDHTSANGEPNLYTDFGAGIMFLPSGLGYYNQIAGAIPQYSPLIFAFKLYDISRLDQDGDGIPSYLEDVALDAQGNPDRYMYSAQNGTTTTDDSDNDGVPDYLDVDDDNDGIQTLTEIKAPNGNPFPFDQIPLCNGIKIHLNPDLTCN